MNLSETKTPVFLEATNQAVATSASTNSRMLGTNPLLQTLSPQELSALMDQGRWRSFAEGQVVSEQGSSVDSVAFIIEGRAKAEIAAPVRAAYRAVVNFLGPGDDIGLLSLVDSAPHSASVIAMEPVKLLAIPFAAMQECLEGHPEWYRAMAEIAISRLRTSGLWLQALI